MRDSSWKAEMDDKMNSNLMECMKKVQHFSGIIPRNPNGLKKGYMKFDLHFQSHTHHGNLPRRRKAGRLGRMTSNLKEMIFYVTTFDSDTR